MKRCAKRRFVMRRNWRWKALNSRQPAQHAPDPVIIRCTEAAAATLFFLGWRKQPDQGYQVRRLLFADPVAKGRHQRSPPIEDAYAQLDIAALRLPAGIGEVRNFTQPLAHRTPRAVVAVTF